LVKTLAATGGKSLASDDSWNRSRAISVRAKLVFGHPVRRNISQRTPNKS
jgi:hypothetical protein